MNKASKLAQRMQPDMYGSIQRDLLRAFYAIIFQPALAVLERYDAAPEKKINPETVSLRNDSNQDALLEAIRTGRVQYRGGVFRGKFSAQITNALRAIGAEWDGRAGVFRLSPASVPAGIKAEATHAHERAIEAHKAIVEALTGVQEKIDQIVDQHPVRGEEVAKDAAKWYRTAAKTLELTPDLSEEARAKLAADYTQNMKLWIKKWSESQIQALRADVEENAMTGTRFEGLTSIIRQRWGVTENKARFLARQETSLFMSKFRQNRYEDAGVTHYRWRTSHDARVRPEADVKGVARLNDHRDLDGKIFAFSSPPIVDLRTGRRANPGEDYNCRCVAVPILKPMEAVA